MTRFIKNTNGQIYEIKRAYQDKYGETLLLAFYSEYYHGEDEDKNNIIRFIVAIGWDKKSKLWAWGHYFDVWAYGDNLVKAYKAAFDDFKKQIKF